MIRNIIHIFLLLNFIPVFLLLNFIPLIAGLFAATQKDLPSIQYIAPCNKPLARIEYIFPGFQVGCYLGSPPIKKDK